jgi:hypothetical protein
LLQVLKHLNAIQGLQRHLQARVEIERPAQVSATSFELQPLHQHATQLGMQVALETLDRIQVLENLQQQAALPEQMPRLVYSPEDLAAGRVRPEMLALGTSLLATYGAMQIDNAIPLDVVATLHDAFMTRYSAYFREDKHPDALRLGDKRYMLTVDLEPPFDDPLLIGVPMVLPIIRELLGVREQGPAARTSDCTKTTLPCSRTPSGTTSCLALRPRSSFR